MGRTTGARPATGLDVHARVVRSGVFSVTGVALAAVAHHVASRQPVPWAALLPALAVVFLAALPWAGRPRSLPGVVAATLAVQVAAHEWLTVTGPAGGLAAGHHGVEPRSATGHGPVVDSGVMLAAHTVAALAVAVLLYVTDDRLAALPSALGRFAEAVRAAVARWVRRWWGAPARWPGAVPRRPSAGDAPATVARDVLDHVLVRRGPPWPQVRFAP